MNIEKLAEKYHWFQIAPDGAVEMFLDHHSLQTFRSCEASFELSMMANIKSKHKSWNLEFGILFHKMVELFYEAKKNNEFDLDLWLSTAAAEWREANLDQFEDHKMYKTLGGVIGFLTMLGQYCNHFSTEVDKLRVIGIEITFGKKKEVPLGTFDPAIEAKDHFKGHGIEFTKNTEVRCYLTGRIDFLMDNGSAIGPLDHKTTAFFKGSPTNSYEPQEGMTGYVYAAQKIIKNNFPELLANRKVDRIWMNFAQITPEADAMKRFRRIPLFKTEWQLEEYRLRQLRTFHKIYDMLVLGERPDWNTAVCNNMFHSECQFRNLHRQASSSAMVQILNADFVVAQPWNPEKLEE